jgi:hypothetical protein
MVRTLSFRRRRRRRQTIGLCGMKTYRFTTVNSTHDLGVFLFVFVNLKKKSKVEIMRRYPKLSKQNMNVGYVGRRDFRIS